MAVSKVEIARRALFKLGDRFNVSSFDERSPQMEAVRELYDEVRDSLLRDFVWGFAKAHETPTRVAVELPTKRWNFAFSFPPDSVRIVMVADKRQIYGYPDGYYPYGTHYQSGSYGSWDSYAQYINDNQRRGIRYDVINIGGQKIIATNNENIEIVYVKRVDDPNLWDDIFIVAFENKLAAAVCPALTGDIERQMELEQLAMMGINKAKELSSSEGEKETTQPASWITARNSYGG